MYASRLHCYIFLWVRVFVYVGVSCIVVYGFRWYMAHVCIAVAWKRYRQAGWLLCKWIIFVIFCVYCLEYLLFETCNCVYACVYAHVCESLCVYTLENKRNCNTRTRGGEKGIESYLPVVALL